MDWNEWRWLSVRAGAVSTLTIHCHVMYSLTDVTYFHYLSPAKTQLSKTQILYVVSLLWRQKHCHLLKVLNIPVTCVNG